MSDNSTEFTDTVNHHLTAITAAAEFSDPDLTPAAAQRHRMEGARDAREALRDYIGNLPDLGDDPREGALDSLNPTTADSVAVLGHERDTVRALLDSGQNLARIIARASESRVAAIYANREVFALGSPDPEEAAAEIALRVFDRLAELGAPELVQAAEAFDKWQAESARRDVLRGLVEGGVSTGALTVLYRSSPDEYAAIHGIHAAAETIRRAVRDARDLDQVELSAAAR